MDEAALLPSILMHTTEWLPVFLLVAIYHLRLFKILNKLVGGPPKYQKCPGSYADIPEVSVQFCFIQLASACA